MNGALVDSNVLLDVFEDDEVWADWSQSVLEQYGTSGYLLINSVIYAEISIGFENIEDLQTTLTGTGMRMVDIPREALFLAGKAFVAYRRSGGHRSAPLPDFFIGGHAAVEQIPLITRDPKRYQTYFPAVELITPPPR